MEHINQLYDELKKNIQDTLKGREASIAITNLEQSQLWAKQAWEEQTKIKDQ